MGDDVFLKFDFDERDIVNGMRVRLAGRLRGALLPLVSSMAAAGILAAIGPPWGRYAAVLLPAVALAGVALVAIRLAPPVMFRGPPVEKQRGMPPPEGFRDATMSVDASEDGIAVTLGPRLANLRWEDCVGVQTDPRCYVLHFGRGEFLVVPRRAFRNERRDAAFRDLLASCMRAARGEADDEAPGDPDEGGAAEADDVSAMTAEAEVPASPVAGATPPSQEEAAIMAGRNDPCPCGSGKKYKKCCLLREQSPG